MVPKAKMLSQPLVINRRMSVRLDPTGQEKNETATLTRPAHTGFTHQAHAPAYPQLQS